METTNDTLNTSTRSSRFSFLKEKANQNGILLHSITCSYRCHIYPPFPVTGRVSDLC